nr:PAS domain-containing protein [Methanobacterium formicicum]
MDTTKIQFQEFFNHTPDIITIISYENRQPGNFIEINKSGLEKLGYSPDEFLKLGLDDLIVPDKRADIPEDTYWIINGKSYFETEFITKNGERIPVETSNSLFQINGRDVILSISRDTSKRKKVEDALRESEEFNRSIIAASPDCIKVLDLEGNLLMMSEGGQNLMEVDDVSLILNTSLIDFYPDEFQPDARYALTRAREGKTAQFTAYCPTLKGTPKWWDVIVTPILNANGTPEKLSAVSRDITARKLADEKLRWSEDRLMMGMDMAHMVYWEYNTEKDLFTFDDQFYALYGTSAEEEGGNMISGQEYTERFVDPSAYETMEKEFAKTFEVDDPDFLSTPQHWMIRADGERRFLQVRFKIMFDEKGNKIGTRGVNQDITELKIAEDKLKLNQDLLLMSMDMAKLVKWEYDIKTDMFTFDDHFYALYGTNAQEQGGYQMSAAEYINRFVPPEEKEYVEKESVKVLEIDDPDIISTIQHGIVRGDGESRFISLRLKAIYDENNQKIGNRGVTQDITEIKKVEEDLQSTKAELERIIESSPAAIIVLDFDGRVHRWSPAAERIFGWTEKEVIGKPSPTVPLDFIEKLHIELDRLRNGKETLFNPLLTPFEVEVFKKRWIKNFHVPICCANPRGIR